MIDNIGNRDMTLLHRAAAKGDVEATRRLLTTDRDIDFKDQSGRTALYWAAASGMPVVVQLLLEAGARVDARNAGQQTPLHAAAQSGHVEAARLKRRR